MSFYLYSIKKFLPYLMWDVTGTFKHIFREIRPWPDLCVVVWNFLSIEGSHGCAGWGFFFRSGYIYGEGSVLFSNCDSAYNQICDVALTAIQFMYLRAKQA